MENNRRLRTEPESRFAGESHYIDLKKALAQLRVEPNSARRNRRQMTLFHRGPVTQALFAFEPEGRLADHSAPGWVTIQALEGQLTVTAAGKTHELEPGMLVTLDPEIIHSVDANAKTGAAMLLTVFLSKSAQ